MKHLQSFITDAIKKMTAQLKLHLLGPRKLAPDDLKYIAFSYHGFDPKTTLEHAYLSGNIVHGGLSDSIDKGTINQLEDNAHNYIKTLEQKAVSDATRAVGELMHEKNKKAKETVDPVERAKQTKQILRQTKKMLREQRKKLASAATTIVEHELNNAQSFGAFDGILSVAKKMGIDDPVCFKIPVKDKDLCFEKNTMIYTTKGLKPAYELKVGDTLRSHKNISGHQDRNKTLNSVVEYTKINTKNCIEVEFDSGAKIVCTPNHPVLIKYKKRYIYWEIGSIPENMWEFIDVVDSFKLSIKERKKMTAHTNLRTLKTLGYSDVWDFIQKERDQITQRYLKQETLISITNTYKKDCDGIRQIISLILKLNGTFSQSIRQNAGNYYNKTHCETVSQELKTFLISNHKDIVNLFILGESFHSISQKLKNASPRSIRLYIKAVVPVDIRKKINRIKKQKANKALQLRKTNDPQLCAKLIEINRQTMLKAKLQGSKPQRLLANLLINNGHKVEYNTPLFGLINVDMIIDGLVVIEFDGSGHDIQARMGNITQKQLKQKDYARDRLCRKNGLKVLRIESKKDLIPQYSDIIKCITDLKDKNIEFIRMSL